MPTKNFKKYFAPIATLSILGTLLTILLFAIILSTLTILFGLQISVLSLLILSAILASIDPSTVIETLNKLHFRKPFIKDIAISESAVNDVAGIMLTRFFLVSALSVGSFTTFSMATGITTFFSQEILEKISLEIVWGIMVGFLGAWILKTWGESIGKKHWSDPALFFSVPVLCFALGSIVGGSGFLAAFVAGLLFESEGKTKEVHDIFENLVDRFIKPIVFVLLGVFAPVQMLVATMTLGALCAIIFMFAIRPLVVYISLLPWTMPKNSEFEWRELLFLSFIRETGAIPAVLLLYAITSGIANGAFILSIAIWIMLFTLIIEPPLTPLVGKFLKVTD
jgi:cell volume regulation protein A